MNRIILIGIVAFLPFLVFGQEEEPVDAKTRRKLLREEKKAEMQRQREEALVLTKKMIEQRRFVLEADQLSDRSGVKIPVNSTINFVLIDTTHCVIQLGSNMGLGSNGVGGVTTEGPVSRYQVHESKKGGNFTVQVLANTTLGAFDLVFFISGDGNAQADVTQSTSGILRRYSGRIMPIELSRVYKGRSY